MKLSELIKDLTKIQEKKGDLECLAYTLEHGLFDLDVTFTSAKSSENGKAHVAFCPIMDYDNE